jgi:phosphotriesterase-related protein
MPEISTVTGKITPDHLGITLTHEHMVLAFPGWENDSLSLRFNLSEMGEVCSQALGRVKEYGVKTIIDATPAELCRNVELDKIVSEKTGLNIICATGAYSEYGGIPCYFRFRGQLMDIVTELYESFMQELTIGIARTGIKAGVIKVATGKGSISPYEEKALRAAARAQKETGVPIITHTEEGTMGPEQVDLLVGEGVDPGKIVVGHMCGNSNLQYQASVISKGAYAAFDRWGIETLYPDNLRKATLLGLLGLGHDGHIVLSQDCNALMLGRPYVPPDYVLALVANWSYTHIFQNIIPQLKAAGVTSAQVDQMLIGNPRSIFS